MEEVTTPTLKWLANMLKIVILNMPLKCAGMPSSARILLMLAVASAALMGCNMQIFNKFTSD